MISKNKNHNVHIHFSINSKKFWKTKAPPRVIFGWKCLWKAIPVRSYINFKMDSIKLECPICEMEEELVEHSLFLCNVARASWFGSRLGLRSHNIPWDGITGWWIINFETTSPSFLKEYDVKAWVLIVWWAIWKAINDYLYRSTPLNPTAILKCANSVLCEASCSPRDSPPKQDWVNDP